LQSRAKLPASFTRDFGHFIHNFVVLQDPKRNRIQIAVERKDVKIYLTDGWSRLKDFYGIGLGGWVTVVYISPVLLNIRVETIIGPEVYYPEKSPPYRLNLLHTPFIRIPNTGPPPYFHSPSSFHHTLERTLTSTDVVSETLVCLLSSYCY
jgi:hypothetical protein